MRGTSLPYEMHPRARRRFPGFETVSFLEPPFFGVKAYQNTAGLLQGVPQQTIHESVPEQRQPADPAQRQGRRDQRGRGGTSLLRYPQNTKKAYNDRFNINFQRQLPGQVVASFTCFFNIGDQQYTYALNNLDPRIDVAQQNALSTIGGQSRSTTT